MESVSKEILIITPIGRIKWLKAPSSLSEILFHLSKTFNTHPDSIRLTDTNLNTEIFEDGYQGLIACDWDIILSLKIDNTLKEMYSGSMPTSEVPMSAERLVQRSPEKKNTEPKAAPVETKGNETILETLTKAVSQGRGRKANPPAKKNEDPQEAKMQESIKILGEWGFSDKAKIRAALIKSNMNIEAAAEILLGG